MWDLKVTMALQHRVFAAFFLYAFALGGLYPRIGEIQRAMGVGEGALGMALIGTAAGTLLSLTWGPPVLDRWGYRRALLWLVPFVALGYALAVWANSPWMLFALLFPAGVAVGAVEVMVNVEADRVEHRIGRRIMNRAHAFWSLGFFAAGLLGAAAAHVGMSPQLQMALMFVLVLLGNTLLMRKFEPSSARPQQGEPQASVRFARPTKAILWLVAMCASAMLLEGAGIDWSSIYMRDVFGASPGLAGLAVAVGALAQGVARFMADRVVERHSPLWVARVALCILVLGVCLVVLAVHPLVSLLAFALMGAGTSVMFPLAMSAAAQRHDRPASINVAALSQLAFLAFLLGPPLLGWVAEHLGIRWAFGICLPLVLCSLWATRNLKTE
jgi:MFS family permease